MARENMFVRHSFLAALEPFGEAERGRLFTAMLEYSITGVEQKLAGNERFIWAVAKDMIDADDKRYQEMIEAKSEAGKKSGEARAYKKWQNKHMLTDVNSVEQNEHVLTDVNSVEQNEHVLTDVNSVEQNEPTSTSTSTSTPVKEITTTHNAREALGSEAEGGAEERGLDPALGEVMSAYLDKLGCYLSSTALGELKGYYDSWGKDVLLHALNVATDAGKLNWAYIRAILRGYAHDRVKTLNDVQRLETEYADAKRRKEARNGTAGRITPRDSGESDSRWGIVPTVDGTV